MLVSQQYWVRNKVGTLGFCKGSRGAYFGCRHTLAATLSGVWFLLSRLRARKKTNKPTHSFSKGSQGAFQGLRGYRRRRVCIKPGTYTDRALRKAVKGFLPQGGSPIAVLVFVSALTSLIWSSGRGTRGNERQNWKRL